MTIRRRRGLGGELQDEIEARARQGWSPAEIHGHLSAEILKGKKDPPDIRTIRGIVKEVKESDTSGTWSIVDCEPEEGRIVLDFLADCTDECPTPFGTLSKTEAEWVVRLRKLAPDASHRVIETLMHQYLSRLARGRRHFRDLDAYLAFRPWESSCRLREYKRSVILRLVPRVPRWEVLIQELSKAERFDPRFSGTGDEVDAFEVDITKRYEEGEPVDSIADRYDVHALDVNEILQRRRAKGGGNQ